MKSWPENVPYAPLARSFAGEPFRAPMMTEFDDGNIRRRRRSTGSISTLRFTIRMPNTAFKTFAQWVEIDLNQGTLPFTMQIWTGSSFESRVCSFREPYLDDPGYGLRHRVSVVLDVEVPQ